MFALQNQSSRFKWRLIILFDIFEVKWRHTKKQMLYYTKNESVYKTLWLHINSFWLKRSRICSFGIMKKKQTKKYQIISALWYITDWPTCKCHTGKPSILLYE